jgi:hypothetical protein
MLDYSPPKVEFVPYVPSDHEKDSWQWTTITGQGWYEDSSAISAMSPSARSNTMPTPPSEPVDTSTGLPMISLPDPTKWKTWKDQWDKENQTPTPSEEY